jgi:hypothetical protein
MGGIGKRFGVRNWLKAKSKRLSKKITIAQKGWGCSLSVEHLPSKHEALLQDPVALKGKEKKMEQHLGLGNVAQLLNVLWPWILSPGSSLPPKKTLNSSLNSSSK